MHVRSHSSCGHTFESMHHCYHVLQITNGNYLRTTTIKGAVHNHVRITVNLQTWIVFSGSHWPHKNRNHTWCVYAKNLNTSCNFNGTFKILLHKSTNYKSLKCTLMRMLTYCRFVLYTQGIALQIYSNNKYIFNIMYIATYVCSYVYRSFVIYIHSC